MPHVWEGTRFSAWIRLLATHRFAVHPRFLWVAAIITIVSFCHSFLWLIQEAFLGHRLRRLPTPQDPIFILGHWRCGTTLLHELLIRDSRHASPNTYQCFEPHHFLVSEKFMAVAAPFLMPSRRPMDDMPAGYDRPQEDEFALCMLGQPSPYLQIAFPNDPFKDLDSLDHRNLDESGKSRWSGVLANFLRRVAYLHPGKRLVLKSPPHSARIGTLLKRFPKAKFIHIVRDPHAMYPSTVRLWKALYRHHALQVPDCAQLDRYVFETGRRLFTALEAGKRLIPDGRFVEVRFEEFVQDPIAQMRSIYDTLGLGEFAKVESQIRDYFAHAKKVRPNKHANPPEVTEAIEREWGEIIRHYGYERQSLSSSVNPFAPAQPHYAGTP
ncbi:MAG: sulfotransferase family protein [Gemmataceae bacterium]